MGCGNSTPTPETKTVPETNAASGHGAHKTETKKDYKMADCVLKFDHFEAIHRLKLENTLVDTDSPNFRKVTGFEVFGTGQPTLVAFPLVLNYIKSLRLDTIVWTNMRQEPVVYANGWPFTPRLSTQLNMNMEFPGISGAELERLQAEFVSVLKGRAAEEEGKVHYFKDTYAEHPDDRKNIEHIVPLTDAKALKTLSDVYAELKDQGFNLSYVRLPIQDEKAPNESDFDLLTSSLSTAPPDAACVFNCQMGKGRTTTGMITGCLLKYALHSVGTDRIQAALVDDAKKAKEPANGFFVVINELLASVPEAGAAKSVLDVIIDLCGEAPKGTGLQNLRDCILWTKQKFEEEPPQKKGFWKHMASNFIERYFYLVCFATYVMAEAKASRLAGKTFTAWMEEHKALRAMCKAGQDSFNWT